MLVEATRPQDQVDRLPVQPGQDIWVAVRRVHALAHPGLRFLIATDGSAHAQAALDLGGQIARLAHARIVLLGYGLKGEALQRHLQMAKEQLGSGLAALEARATLDPLAEAVKREVERMPCDLVVLGAGGREDQALAEQVFQAGEHNLLLVSHSPPSLSRALICVTSGEQGKDDVLFAGRLMRHLGAEATVMSVLPENNPLSLEQDRTDRFLASGVRSLDLLGVPARTVIRYGATTAEIGVELSEGGYDLLVLGAPLADLDGQITLSGVVGQLLNKVTEIPILIVRSAFY